VSATSAPEGVVYADLAAEWLAARADAGTPAQAAHVAAQAAFLLGGGHSVHAVRAAVQQAAEAGVWVLEQVARPPLAPRSLAAVVLLPLRLEDPDDAGAPAGLASVVDLRAWKAQRPA
jgi:hypothetical protein